MQVHVVDHPLAAARLTTLRDERTDNAGFRAALRELTLLLIYEATRDAPCEPVPIRTPLAETVGSRLTKPPLLVPVLRAGLGMVDEAHAALPEAHVGFVGVARDEQTHQPVPYLDSLPDDLTDVPVMVLDPMVATGGSMTHTLGLLISRGAADCCVWLRRQKESRRCRRLRQTCGCSLRPSTKGLTRSPTLCPVSAMPAIASSARAESPPPPHASRQLIDPRPHQLSGSW